MQHHDSNCRRLGANGSDRTSPARRRWACRRVPGGDRCLHERRQPCRLPVYGQAVPGPRGAARVLPAAIRLWRGNLGSPNRGGAPHQRATSSAEQSTAAARRGPSAASRRPACRWWCSRLRGRSTGSRAWDRTGSGSWRDSRPLAIREARRPRAGRASSPQHSARSTATPDWSRHETGSVGANAGRSAGARHLSR